MDPAKLKVVELRAELSARGLDTKGVKAVLVERLKEALEEETGQGVPDTSIVETSTEEADYSEDKVDYSEPDKDNSEPEQQQTPESDENQDQPSEDQNQEVEESYQEFEQDDSQKEQEPPSPEPERESTPEPESQVDYPEQENTFESENYGSEAYQSESYQSAPAPAEEQAEYSESQKVEEAEDKSQDAEMENITIKQESFGDEFKQQHYEEKPDITQYQGFDQENDKKEHYEAEVKMEPGVEVKEERDDRQDDRKRKRSRWSPQPQQKQGWGQRADWGRKDDEPDLDENAMVLGWYDSDLNIEINREDFLEAAPMSAQGFGYIWAGCRATFGFNQGNVCYEVKLLENHDVTHLEDEPSPHVLRVGWSTLDTDMMLGEEPKSYGYGGTGKVSTNCKFSNYGCSFVVGDVVTAYLEYGEDRVKLSYGVNGKFLGEAFNFPLSEIDSQPLFPHILSKNIKFRVNFGLSDPECPVEPGYTWAAHVPLEQRVAGPRRPERREDCEMLMMCGLPGCGKTTWANAFVKENRDKFYNILGTNNLIDKMKIQGLPRKRNYHGRWDVLIDKCTKCLNKLLEMASRRRRNYILDQTNVYPSAQKRKMRNFGGFIRRAIVIVPNDEEFQRRCAKREAEEGKDIPDSAVLEMKANFRLPEEGEHFDEVRFIELNREESQPLVEQYNKEGRAAGFGQQSPFGQGGGNKKFRPNDRPPFRGGGGFRGGRGGFGGGMDRKDRGPDRGPGGRGGFRSGGMDRGGRGGWGPRGGGPDRGPPRGGGWRDRSPGGGGFDRDMDSRAPGGGPWRNQRGNDRDRPYDRSQRGGPRGGGGNFRDNDYGNRGGGFRDGGYDRDDYRGGGGGGYNNREDNFRDGRGGGRGRGGRGGFDRDNKGGGRGGFDRNRGGFNDRRGGGNRDGGFDRNRGGDNRGPRDNKGGGGQGNQGGQGGGGWGNQTYQGGWGQQGYNQQGYNQQYNQGYNQGYNQQQQQPNAQQGWGQQAWGNKGTGQQQGVAGATGATATAAATGYNTAGYAQQATGYNQAAGYQGYWGQYGYGQGWTQNADGTYSYPQGWQGYGYNYGAAMTPAAGVTPGMAAATPAAAAATPAAPQAPANK